MKYKAKQFFLILPALILVSAFSSFAQGDLTRGKWKLTEANGRAATNSAAFIDFEPGLAKYTGNTGCNGLTGSVEARGRSIDFTTIATTKRMCKLMAGNVPEGEFLNALQDTTRFTIDGNALRLFDRRGRRVLRFTRTASDQPTIGPAKLAGRKWSLESIKGRQTFVPLPDAFVRFDEKRKSVGGDTSCNSFGGSYRISGRDSIAVTNVIMTMRACLEDNKMAVQHDLTEGLRAANRYEIRDGRLFLYRGTRLELTFRQDND
jgi:heat shock protein HslJ